MKTQLRDGVRVPPSDTTRHEEGEEVPGLNRRAPPEAEAPAQNKAAVPAPTKGGSTEALSQVSKDIKLKKDTCTPMFTAALFTITKMWKQPKCPMIDEWIKKA